PETQVDPVQFDAGGGHPRQPSRAWCSGGAAGLLWGDGACAGGDGACAGGDGAFARVRLGALAGLPGFAWGRWRVCPGALAGLPGGVGGSAACGVVARSVIATTQVRPALLAPSELNNDNVK